MLLATQCAYKAVTFSYVVQGDQNLFTHLNPHDDNIYKRKSTLVQQLLPDDFAQLSSESG